MKDYKELPISLSPQSVSKRKHSYGIKILLLLSCLTVLTLLIFNTPVVNYINDDECSVDESLINQSFNEGYDKGIYDISSKAITDKEIPVFKTLDGVTTIEFKSLQEILDG